jgi:hypothetical protein
MDQSVFFLPLQPRHCLTDPILASASLDPGPKMEPNPQFGAATPSTQPETHLCLS